jgi:hypothetical protein
MPADDNAPKPSPSVQQTATPPKKASFGKGVMVGAACIGGAYSFGWFGSESRYPVRVEYEIARTCVDGGDAPLFPKAYLAKQERCLCALEETMKAVPYEKYRKNTSLFVSTFRESAAVCKDKGRS